MQPNKSPFKKSLSLLTVCLALSACSSLMGGDDEDSSNIYGTVKLPPRITDPANRNTSPTTSPISLKKVEPSVAINAPLPAAAQAPLDISEPVQATPPVSAVKTASVTQQKQVPVSAEDAGFVPGPMLFAPYIPTLREGQPPKRWQKQPSYDFPWIPGATPTRINEETVVGYGEQMLGRIYAHAAFTDRSTTELTNAEPVQVKPLPTATAGKKGSKNSKSSENAPVSLSSSSLKNVQCDGGATCLDAARDALVEDAKAKGWEMMLSRRVSLHNSFQFSRGERVIWVELNSNGKRELDIEYTLMPIQAQAQNN